MGGYSNEINDYYCLSIFTLILFCWPIGLVALSASRRVSSCLIFQNVFFTLLNIDLFCFLWKYLIISVGYRLLENEDTQYKCCYY